jgi:hypothetical protein
MDKRPEDQTSEQQQQKEEGFEVTINPNPRANENINPGNEPGSVSTNKNGVGSEITDGEAG